MLFRQKSIFGDFWIWEGGLEILNRRYIYTIIVDIYQGIEGGGRPPTIKNRSLLSVAVTSTVLGVRTSARNMFQGMGGPFFLA